MKARRSFNRRSLPGVATIGKSPSPAASLAPKRFRGAVTLDPTRVDRDAGRIADEIIAHLSGLVGARVKVTLEIETEIPNGMPDHVVRTVTESSRSLKFSSHGFEEESLTFLQSIDRLAV